VGDRFQTKRIHAKRSHASRFHASRFDTNHPGHAVTLEASLLRPAAQARSIP
jgi:hypothetical protein